MEKYVGKHSSNKEVRGKYIINNPLLSKIDLKKTIITCSTVLIFMAGMVSPDMSNSPSGHGNEIVIADYNEYESRLAKLYQKYEIDSDIHEKLSSSQYGLEGHVGSGKIILDIVGEMIKSSEYNGSNVSEILQDLSVNEELKKEIIEQVKEKLGFENGMIAANINHIIPVVECDKSKLDAVLQDEELIKCIDEASVKFGRIPKSLMVALAAVNYENRDTNVMGITDGWKNITSSQSVYEISDTDEVIEHKLEVEAENYGKSRSAGNYKNEVNYSAMVICRCFKNQGFGGDIRKVIEDYFPNDMDVDIREEKVNEVINYMFLYNNDRQFKFEYYYYCMNEFRYQEQRFVSLDYEEYLSSLYDEVVSDITNAVILGNNNLVVSGKTL